MEPDLWSLYEQMYLSRLYEEATAVLWNKGLISGEMHMGIGEEAIIAGTVCQIQEGDALALDHRGTAAMLMRGVDPVALLREFLGHPEGLSDGKGGHMHLFSPEHLAASSGIVGSSGPAAAGFALAARYLRPDNLALAFFGEGAVNEGMMMETMNLAVIWNLPLVFICKDNDWSISTRSSKMIGAELCLRAQGFGLATADVDGTDVTAVWSAAAEAMTRAREGDGPTFLHCRCRHFEGHFLGDQLLRISRRPLDNRAQFTSLLRALLHRQGAGIGQRLASLREVLVTVRDARAESKAREDDPLLLCRAKLNHDLPRLDKLEATAVVSTQVILQEALS